MRYFYDTEFIEDGKTIDLISIGIVCEDGREYYAISTEFNATEASDWVKQNVLIHLPPRERQFAQGYHPWVSRATIKSDLLDFCDSTTFGKPEFWAYYADYDHVALCQLFGAMMDLPKGWPMYTRDLKQLCVSIGDPKLPEQDKGEHHALADARWNKKVFDFLLSRQREDQANLAAMVIRYDDIDPEKDVEGWQVAHGQMLALAKQIDAAMSYVKIGGAL